MKFIVTLLIVSLTHTLQAQLSDTPAIFPKPQQIQWKEGEFTLSKFNTYIKVKAGRESSSEVRIFNNVLQKQYGFSLKQAIVAYHSNYIRLAIQKYGDAKEGYHISVKSDSIIITGNDSAGLRYGIQTLLQLIEKETKKKETPQYTYTVPAVEIEDYPRFAYRGMHLDVCRHFFDVSYVKKYIDYLAAYKFNTFHWHLTDDQGWRIEIKKYPKLTAVGGYRNGTIIGRYPGKGNDGLRYGGFYTQVQIKEVVKYAAERYITVIPEIEMPGHASAAIAAYPQLSCFPNESTKPPPQCAWAGDTTGKQVQQTWGVFEDVFCPSEYTFGFLQDVLDEVMPLFPSQYIHIGGDECPKTAWKRSAFCQQLMKERGLKDEHELQSYFIQRMEKYVNSKGRRIIGWDEILEGGLAPNATVMSWTGEKGGITAAQQNHDVVMTPSSYVYFDYSQTKNEDSVTIGGYIPIEKVYNYDPIPAVLTTTEAKHILGAQANLWTEYITNPAKVEYMLFPRMAALSEVLWTKKENKSWGDFEKRLPVLLQRLDYQQLSYSEEFYRPNISILPSPDFKSIFLNAKSKDTSNNITITFIPSDFNGINYSDTLNTSENSENTTLIIRHSGQYMILGRSPRLKKVKDKPMLMCCTSQTEDYLTFSFNKATGKKITLTNEPSKSYPGNGAFTLVDGIQNDRRLERSSELLGFSGKDCEAVIDLGKTDTISKVVVHCLNQQPSWIHLPKKIEVSISSDGETYTSQPVFAVSSTQPGNNAITVPIAAIIGRFVKLKITNAGKIPDAMPGGGSPAWLMVDEVEIW